jgi:putative transposase
MKLGSLSHQRRSLRLKEYDYSQSGAYFVTLVTKSRECLFGEVNAGVIQLTKYGTILQRTWTNLPLHYPNIILEAFVVMPNHIHAIIGIIATDSESSGLILGNNSEQKDYLNGETYLRVDKFTNPNRKTRHSLPEIVRAFKSFSARQINQMRHTPGIALWQRNYYDHIIRNQAEMERIVLYIQANPGKWLEDEENPLVNRKV